LFLSGFSSSFAANSSGIAAAVKRLVSREISRGERLYCRIRMSDINSLNKACGICCVLFLLLLNVSAGGLEIATQTNGEGMIDSIVTVPGTKALKEIRLRFRGVMQNFNPEVEDSKEFVANEEETIVGLNVKQATKQNDVYLLLRDSEGDFKVITNVNEKVAKLLSDKDLHINNSFIFVLSIKGNICKMGTSDYQPNNPSVESFSVSIDVDGRLRLVKK
jgi:hypothetical protein